MLSEKSLNSVDADGATKNVKDIIFWGDGDTFQLICKASSDLEGWMKSTKAMEIPGVGCIVQVTTHQKNLDGTNSIAEAVTFVPGVQIQNVIEGGKVVSRQLVSIYPIHPSTRKFDTNTVIGPNSFNV